MFSQHSIAELASIPNGIINLVNYNENSKINV